MIYDRIGLKQRNNFANPPVDKKTEKFRKSDTMENRPMTKIIALDEESAVDLEELINCLLIIWLLLN